MRIDRAQSDAEVTLSRRNLLSLLNKLDREGSARELRWTDPDTGLTLTVHSESDDEHYFDRPVPPGDVHPDDDPGFEGDGQYQRGQVSVCDYLLEGVCVLVERARQLAEESTSDYEYTVREDRKAGVESFQATLELAREAAKNGEIP